MAKQLMILRRFYLFPSQNEEPFNSTELYRLNRILTYMYNTTSYPTRDILKEFATNCENLVIRGMIFGTPINVTEYFRKRSTSESACCMFNYHRASNSANKTTRDLDNEHVRNSGRITIQSNSILNSLQFVLQSDPDDFTVKDFSHDAFVIYLFPNRDYATIQSNKMGDILINHNRIVEVPIQPTFFGSTYRVRQFAPATRQCYFLDEGQKLLNHSYYSLDECLLVCRTESMLKYCGCISPPMHGSAIKLRQCGLMDLPCLTKWNPIWHDLDYFDYVREAEETSAISETRCPHCLPTCNGVSYKYEITEMAIGKSSGEFYKIGLLKGLPHNKPLAILKLFFEQRFAIATEMDIKGDWLVLLNRFGGIMSLMYGFGIVSYIEILYFASGKFFTTNFFKCFVKIQRKLSTLSAAYARAAKNRVQNENDPPPDYELYWSELKPKLPTDMDIFKYEYLNVYKREIEGIK